MDDMLRIRSRYAMLQIPFVSWVLLVFPLILPPIPIGPIAVSLAWNRFEQMELVRRARRFINRPAKEFGFPAGWLVNFFINMADIITLGLRSAFAAASLADKVDYRANRNTPPQNNVKWLVKWLFLGNVFFLAAWIVFPGWVLLHLVRNMEQVMFDQYRMEPVHVEIETEAGEHKTVSAYPAYTPQVLNSGRITMLGVYNMPLAPTETTESNALVESLVTQLRTCSDQLLAYDVPVFWCNVSRLYPTHYQQVGAILPKGSPHAWYAFSNGRIVCGASTCSEAIAKALGIPAKIRAVENMVIGAYAADVRSLMDTSFIKPVVCFIHTSMFSPTELIKNATPAFLQTVSSSNAAVFFLPHTKEEPLGSQLKAQGLLFKGCAVIYRGQITARIKIGWTTAWPDDLNKIAKELSAFDTQQALVLSKDAQHAYKALPCYIYGQWEQVIKASALQRVVLACGPHMDTQKAEVTFLQRTGNLFIERGYQLAVAPIEKNNVTGSVADGLRAAGQRSEGCYVIHHGQVIAAIAKTAPQTALADCWLPDAVKYLAQGA
ncbi:MAG: hypothetical protein ACYCX2_10020 [Christensenellales bacterium]